MEPETPPANHYIVGAPQPIAAVSVPSVATTAAPSAAPIQPAPAVAAPIQPLPPLTQAAQLQLPTGVVTQADTGRLVQEAEAVDNFLGQAAVRQPGTAVQLPKVSRLFDEIVAINKLNLLQAADRQRLSQFLQSVRARAPILHISFNIDPSPIFQQSLITWIRQQIHPLVLLQIGLHPSIGAGCVVRTTNKYYDFSLRKRFDEQRPLLISKLRGTDQAVTPTAVVKEPA